MRFLTVLPTITITSAAIAQDAQNNRWEHADGFSLHLKDRYRFTPESDNDYFEIINPAGIKIVGTVMFLEEAYSGDLKGSIILASRIFSTDNYDEYVNEVIAIESGETEMEDLYYLIYVKIEDDEFVYLAIDLYGPYGYSNFLFIFPDSALPINERKQMLSELLLNSWLSFSDESG